MEENNKKTLNKYDYYAFISYSTTDEKWAKWLHKHLESYNLPNALRRSNNSLPKYIRPVFWYKTDLSGTELHGALEKELTSSRHLVLICSPESAKSVWVNDEVKSFVESNRTDYIIPFIVSGQPDKPEGEDYCYPQVLRDMPRTKMLRGIDVSKVGKQHALIDVVSTMFGLRFDALWQRHKRAQIRRNICYALFALILVLAGIGIWDYNRSTYEYYTDYVDVYGVPQGIYKLTDEQKSHREHSFRFEYRRIPFGEPNAYSWRLHSVSYVNSVERLKEYESVIADRFALQIYSYNKATGKLAYVENYDHFGTLQCRYQYSKRDGIDACIVDIEGGSEERSLGFSSISSTSRTAEDDKSSNITRFIFLRDSLGHIIRKTYHSNNDYILDRSITADYDGVYGQSYKLDSLGRVVEIELLNKEMQPFQTSGGFSRLSFEYDIFSNIRACAYYNSNNCLTPSPNGWAKFEDFYDSYGNCIEERTYDKELKLWKHDGSEIKKWKYDKQGFQIELKSCNDKGESCMNDYQFSIKRAVYDKFGHERELRFYDTHEKPVMAYDQYSIIRMTYDDNGNQTSSSAYDINDKPCYIKDGYSSSQMMFNDSHLPTEELYLGIDGKPCLRKEGYSKVINVWNDQNQLVEERFFGVDGKPCLKEGGLSLVKYAYDERGNKCEESYYGVDGSPCLCQTNYHLKRTKWNDKGDIIENTFYDVNGKPCKIGQFYHCRRYTYDSKGNTESVSYYDESLEPCVFEGVHLYTYQYDDKGNVIKSISFDVRGKLCKNDDNYAITESEYDSNGYVIKQSFFDENHNLCISNEEGYAMVVYERNSIGLKVKGSYFNQRGNLFLYQESYAIKETKYDVYNNIIEAIYYDEKGNLGRKDGIARIKYIRDTRSNIIEASLFDKNNSLYDNGEGIAIYRYVYDDKNQELSMSCYGKSNQPTLNEYGFFKYQCSYDERGNEIGCVFYGIDGRRVKRDSGYAAYRCKYDDRNNLLRLDYLDEKLKPCNIDEGYSYIVYKYSDNYNSRICSYYDIAGKLVKEEKE